MSVMDRPAEAPDPFHTTDRFDPVDDLFGDAPHHGEAHGHGVDDRAFHDPVEDGLGPVRHRRASGRRSAQVARRRRSEVRQRRTDLRRRGVVGALVVLVVVGLVAGGTALLGGPGGGTEQADDSLITPTVVDQTVFLLTRTEPDVRGAAGITIMAAGEDGSASAIFVPTTSLVEIPGVGLDRLGLAFQYGGIELLAAAVENALGIQLDGTVTVGQNELGTLLQRAGGAEIDVPGRLIDRAADGTGVVAFDAGPQYLNGLRLATFWSFSERGESELDTFPRQQRAVEAMLTAFADPVVQDNVLADIPRELTTDLEAEALLPAIRTMAAAAADDVMVYSLLPVAPFGTADETLGVSYQILDADADQLIADQLAAAIPDTGTDGPQLVQILNGVGAPGIGAQVDAQLQGTGVRIIRTENARSFGFLDTQIVIYEENAAQLRAAEQVRAALGVGRILVSRQPQSVVDLTIVVGSDFLDAERVPGP